MEQVRLILSLVSFAIGALIALRALFRKSSGPRRSPALGLLYSTLFVIAGVWLLQRSAEPQQADLPKSVEFPKTQPIREQQSHQAPAPTTPTNTQIPAKSEEQESLPLQQSRDLSEVSSEAPIRRTSAAPWDKKLEVSQNRLNRHRPDFSASSKRNRKAEEVVEDAVIRAFDWIELFFARYASPTPVTSASRKEQSTSSALARISFVSGTSELEPASASLVRAMAPTLASRFPDGALVVRAAAEGDSFNPALRNMLAQARAQAVCQALSSGGFPAERLIASAKEASDDASGVEFVHRP